MAERTPDTFYLVIGRDAAGGTYAIRCDDRQTAARAVAANRERHPTVQAVVLHIDWGSRTFGIDLETQEAGAPVVVERDEKGGR